MDTLALDVQPPQVSTWTTYDEYLQTPHWISRRALARERAGNKCQLCGDSNRELHVHHNCYDHLGNEPDEDLIVLCDECHARHHRREPVSTSYTGLVCPDCGTEWAVLIAIVQRTDE